MSPDLSARAHLLATRHVETTHILNEVAVRTRFLQKSVSTPVSYVSSRVSCSSGGQSGPLLSSLLTSFTLVLTDEEDPLWVLGLL